jgi:carbamate kinase
MMDSRLIVVALGGNAVSLPHRQGNIPEQFAATRAAMLPLADLIQNGDRLLITHGNGPQLGNVMRRIELAASEVYPLPLDIVVADTEAGMGYMVCQCLMNELSRRGHPRVCTTIVTTVRVDGDDPAFTSPDKPVGPFLAREQAMKHRDRNGWVVVEVANQGWRRVVPSPRPQEIVELSLLRKLLCAGEIVVAAGGGGIPVIKDPGGNYVGVEAVIDKDRTSALLASQVDADLLAILTNVDSVQRDYGTPSARAIERMTAGEATQLIAQGQFARGSMLPKIEAAVEFLGHSSKAGAEVLITSCERAADGFSGKIGTRVVRN